MPRVDVWDIAAIEDTALDCAYPRGLEEKYDLSGKLGEGGFGTVRIARSKATGTEYACK